MQRLIQYKNKDSHHPQMEICESYRIVCAEKKAARKALSMPAHAATLSPRLSNTSFFSRRKISNLFNAASSGKNIKRQNL